MEWSSDGEAYDKVDTSKDNAWIKADYTYTFTEGSDFAVTGGAVSVEVDGVDWTLSVSGDVEDGVTYAVKSGSVTLSGKSMSGSVKLVDKADDGGSVDDDGDYTLTERYTYVTDVSVDVCLDDNGSAVTVASGKAELGRTITLVGAPETYAATVTGVTLNFDGGTYVSQENVSTGYNVLYKFGDSLEIGVWISNATLDEKTPDTTSPLSGSITVGTSGIDISGVQWEDTESTSHAVNTGNGDNTWIDVLSHMYFILNHSRNGEKSPRPFQSSSRKIPCLTTASSSRPAPPRLAPAGSTSPR